MISWDKIVSLYFETKRLFIECETINSEIYPNLQPLNEFRATLDHLMRVIACKNDSKLNIDIEKEMIDIYAHLFRAYKDVSYLLILSYRNKIIKCLKKYSTKSICSAIPDYFYIKRNINDITNRLNELRSYRENIDFDKDIEDLNVIISEMRRYYHLIDEAEEALTKVQNDSKVRKAVQILLPIGIGVIGIILGIIGFII